MAKGTITVNLERDWFAPDSSLYQARDNPHEFPAHWEDQIPRIKKVKRVTTTAPLPEAPKPEYEVDEDARDRIILGETKTVVTLQRTADGTDLPVAQAIEGDVKSVGGALDDKGLEQPNQSVADAQKGAKALDAQVGGKPRESGPLPAGTQKK